MILQAKESKILREEMPELDKDSKEVQDAIFALKVEKSKVGRAGYAIAAPQIGHRCRVIFFKHPDFEKTMTFINPEIVEKRGEETAREGCLSLRDRWFNVKRATHIKIKFWNHLGFYITMEFDGPLARILQHEVDHLDGILIDTIGGEIK